MSLNRTRLRDAFNGTIIASVGANLSRLSLLNAPFSFKALLECLCWCRDYESLCELMPPSDSSQYVTALSEPQSKGYSMVVRVDRERIGV